jgi:hypothetical protein
MVSVRTGKPLIDKYDVYQHLMDYWAETMQDDCYLIAADGWKAETARVLVKNNKGKEVDKVWTCDLVPKCLIVARHFAAEQAAITALEAELESTSASSAPGVATICPRSNLAVAMITSWSARNADRLVIARFGTNRHRISQGDSTATR